VLHISIRAQTVNWMLAAGLIFGLVLFVDGEAIGPFASVVGEDGMDP
jgi:hypothetical protein